MYPQLHTHTTQTQVRVEKADFGQRNLDLLSVFLDVGVSIFLPCKGVNHSEVYLGYLEHPTLERTHFQE